LSPNDPNDKVIIDRLIPGQLNFQPDIFIHLTIPNEFQKVGKYNVGITAGIETTTCRAEWIEGCNRMDLVLTSSVHSKRVFETTKYEKRDQNTNQLVEILQLSRPTEVLFEGVDTDIYGKAPDKTSDIYKQISKIEEKSCYLFVGHWMQGDLGQDRKDVGMLVKVFMETFRNKGKANRPALVLKTSMAGFSEPEYSQIIEKIQNIRKMVQGDSNKQMPNVYVLYGSLSDKEMNDLYAHPKITSMVSFTHGEGFGRPLLEFTTTGKPVIASGWSGQLDFLHPQYSVHIPGQLENVHQSAVNDWIIQGSQWFRVNYESASRLLLSVNDKYDKYLELTRKHKKVTTDNFSLDKMGEHLINFLEKLPEYSTKVSQEPPKKMQLNLPKLKLGGGEQPKLSLPQLNKV